MSETEEHIISNGEWNGVDTEEVGSEGIPEHHDASSETDDKGKGKEKEKVLKPLTKEALAEFEEAQRKAGIIYISRIPPRMRPQKLRHIMSAYGEVGRIYMTLEDEACAKARRKQTTSNTRYFTEGWVEFTDKRVARSVAELLNAKSVGGKRGSRYKDDVWTMKYLPKFKWNMLTEQLHHDKVARTARLRIEIAQSKQEQEEYLRQVSLGKKFEHRAKRKKRDASDNEQWSNVFEGPKKKPKSTESVNAGSSGQDTGLQGVLGKIF